MINVIIYGSDELEFESELRKRLSGSFDKNKEFSERYSRRSRRVSRDFTLDRVPLSQLLPSSSNLAVAYVPAALLPVREEIQYVQKMQVCLREYGKNSME